MTKNFIMGMHWEELIRLGISKLEEEGITDFWDEWKQSMCHESKSASYYYSLGNHYQQQEDYQTAIKQYTEAINCDSKYFNAYYYRGSCYDNIQEFQKAIADYTEVIKLRPNFTDAYFHLGYTFQTLGNFFNAIDNYNQAIELDADYTQAYFYRGAIYSYLGDYETAVADFSTLIEYQPTAANYYNRGVIYYLREDYENSIADLTETLKINAQFNSAYFHRGNAYHQLKNQEQAGADYQKGKETELKILDSQDEHGYYGKGIAYLNQEDQEKGLEYLKQAMVACRQAGNATLNLEIASIIKKTSSSKE